MRTVSPVACVVLSALVLVVLGGSTCKHKKRPDLRVTGAPATFPATQAGNPVAITVTAQNFGKKASNGFVLSAYLSQTGVIDGSSIFMGSSPVQPALLAGASAAVPVWSPVVPAGATPTLPGVYKLIVLIDATKANDESDEENNTQAGDFVVLSGTGITDLSVTQLSLSHTAVTRGQSVKADWGFVNLGDQASPPTSDNGFYLSADAIFDGADTYLGVSVSPNYSAGSIATGTSTLLIPTATAAGSYNILFVLDRTSAVGETDEFNNVIAKPITVSAPIGVDYVSSNSGVSRTVGRGGAFVVTETMANAGSTAAVNPVRVGAYLSTSSAPTINTSGSLLVGSSGVGPLAATTAGAVTITVTIPATLSVGDYYLGYVVDDLGQETETDEANNGSSVIKLTVVEDDSMEDNDVIATATPIATNTLFSNRTVLAGDDDWYRVTLGGVSNTLIASISNSVPGDAKIEIYDGGGTLIGAGAVTGTGWSGTLSGLVAGNYYLKVYIVTGTAVSYNLAASTTAPVMGEGDSGAAEATAADSGDEAEPVVEAEF